MHFFVQVCANPGMCKKHTLESDPAYNRLLLFQERVPFSKDDMPECMYELVQMHLCNLPNSSHTDLVNKKYLYPLSLPACNV